MKWSAVAAALVMAAAPIAAQSQQQSTTQAPAASTPRPQAASGAKLTLHGCVRAGVEKDTVLMTDVTEVPQAGRSALPTEAHGRKVLFWLDRDDDLKAHVGRMVEVTGTPAGLEESEVELKAGRQKGGGLVAEFEGPGRDVKASNETVGQALGTSGRTASEKNDIKTFLMKVKVESVRPVAGTCG
jgi:hypothetical protein